MVLSDLWQALSDLALVLSLTVLLLAILFGIGLWLKRQSFKIQIKADKQARYAGSTRQAITTELNYTASFLQGISTELFGAVFTTLAFGLVLLVFQQYQSIQNRKAELILQMGSPDNSFAVEAARQLSALGWLYDGTLQGAYLARTNLQGAFLPEANFQGAEMTQANLQDTLLTLANFQGAGLVEGNLQGAFLQGARFQDANIFEANLQGAYLEGANLQDAHLFEANLQDANLQEANLQGVNLKNASFDENTILPDHSKWTPDTDMARFTDPQHPDFWQPEWLKQGEWYGAG